MKSNVYYGGDKTTNLDEDSRKLFLSECRKKQGELYPAHLFRSRSITALLGSVSDFDLLVSAGSSRLHLHLDQLRIISGLKTRAQANNLTERLNVPDFVLFTTDTAFPRFPNSFTREVSVFRSHGMPLLVWPLQNDKKSMTEYFTQHYPDCAFWFRELDKVGRWLSERWQPLINCLDIGHQTDSLISSSADCKKRSFIVGVPDDSVAAAYILKRSDAYAKYANKLKEYFIQRRLYSPGFKTSPLHKELFNLCSVNGKRSRQSIDSDQVSDTEMACSDNSEEDEYDHSDDDQMDSDVDTNDAGASGKADGTSQQYESRPASKEIMDNRGLVKYRHRRERNPRVHLRHKYRKATIRYRSRVAPMRNQNQVYSGEARGIKVNLVRSHKFKRPH